MPVAREMPLTWKDPNASAYEQVYEPQFNWAAELQSSLSLANQ